MIEKKYPIYEKIALKIFIFAITVMMLSCASTEKDLVPSESLPVKSTAGIHRGEEDANDDQKDPRQELYLDFIKFSLSMNDGDYLRAREYLKKVIDKDPENAYLKIRMALLLQRLKDYGNAAEYARQYIDLMPDDLGARIILAEALAMSGDDNSAREQYLKILEIQPGNQRVRLILCTSYIRAEMYQEALGQLDTILEQNPDLAIAYYYKGRINLELEKPEEAEKNYLEAIDRRSSIEEHALFDLAGLYFNRKEYSDAVKMYERLLSRFPENLGAKERLINTYYRLGEDEKADALMGQLKEMTNPGDPGRQALGLIYLRHGRLDESIMELDLVVSTWPEDDKSRYYLALAYEEKGEDEKALHHFYLIQEDSEYYIHSRIQIAYILDQLERHDEAIGILEESIQKGRGDIELYLMLASLFEAKEDYKKTIEIIQEGLTLDTKNVDLIFRLGVVYDKLGEKEKSIEQMKRILEINENHADALNYIGYTYAEQGIHLDEAMEMVNRALTIKPDSGYIIDSLGWIYFQKGLYEKALEILEKAHSLIPGDPTVAEHLGDVLCKREEYQRSLEMYKKALSLKPLNEDLLKEKIEKVKDLLK